MAQVLHSFHIRTFNLIRRRLTHFRSSTPIKLPSKEVNWTFLRIDLVHTVSCIEAAEVEIEIAVEDSVRLAAVHMPDELFVDIGGFRSLVGAVC